MHCIVDIQEDSPVRLLCVDVDVHGGAVTLLDTITCIRDEFPQLVTRIEQQQHPRWVWADTRSIYAELLTHNVRVDRAYDLRLCRAILRNNRWVDTTLFISHMKTDALELSSWDKPPRQHLEVLFDTEPTVRQDPRAEFERQMRVLASADHSQKAKLNYLLAAESAGALIAAEMTHAGVPWNKDVHNALLVEALGERPRAGQRPSKLEELAGEVREILNAPTLNPDSPKDLLKALRAAGLDVESTSKWQLREHKHPVVPVLTRYKKLSRMMTANGWNWMDEWVHNNRFRPVYVPGGVVTGRWGADGGGALQLPHFVRPAVVADDGWSFVIADAAQLEPRILAAMSGDEAMARAGRGHDLYQGIADAGVVESREHAKFGMLGAMYGGTTGVSAQVLPKFKVAFPKAMALVEGAARAGENGGTVHTWLGRTSLPADFDTLVEGDDSSAARDRRSRMRSYGRFTRNFICQGTAAEWALLWMAEVRRRLWSLSIAHPSTSATSSFASEATLTGTPPITNGPHLVFFLHDEILIHTPTELAREVQEITHQAAQIATQHLFRGTTVDFPVSSSISTTYTDPKGSSS